jgi:hypothetical protein
MAIHVAWRLATLLGLASPALAENCRLALVLALDVSASVDSQEHQLQREGLARALVAPEVMRAFLMGDPVTLYIFEWSGQGRQTPLSSGWQIVQHESDLIAFAGSLLLQPRPADSIVEASTALGAALAHADAVLQEAPNCRAQTVDVSGDGRNNQGEEPQRVYESGLLGGALVNALVIEDAQGKHALSAWFERNVLHGPGAFLVVADGYEDYERAMRLKLLRELELPVVGGAPVTRNGA